MICNVYGLHAFDSHPIDLRERTYGCSPINAFSIASLYIRLRLYSDRAIEVSPNFPLLLCMYVTVKGYSCGFLPGAEPDLYLSFEYYTPQK